MPRRKQGSPKKHDAVTEATVDASSSSASVDDQRRMPSPTTTQKRRHLPLKQPPTPPLDCSKRSSKSSGNTPSICGVKQSKELRPETSKSNDTEEEDEEEEEDYDDQSPLDLSVGKRRKIDWIDNDDVRSSGRSANVSPLINRLSTQGSATTATATATSSATEKRSDRTNGSDDNRSCSSSEADSLSNLVSLVHRVGTGPQSISGGQQPRPDTGGQLLESDLSSSGSLLSNGGNGLSFQELWWRFVKKEENAELKRLNEAKQIFTCLQCQASFQTMEQLVKHMEATQHYANIPKHYSWSLQYARQRMRQMKLKMKYSDKMMYYCFLCTAPFTEPVHIHFNCVHNMHNPAENMKFVHVISVGGGGGGGGKDHGKHVASGGGGGGAASKSSASPPTSGSGSVSGQPEVAAQARKRRGRKPEETLPSPAASLSSGCCESNGSSTSPAPPRPASGGSLKSGAKFKPPAAHQQQQQQQQHHRPSSPDSTSNDNLLLKMERFVRTAV